MVSDLEAELAAFCAIEYEDLAANYEQDTTQDTTQPTVIMASLHGIPIPTVDWAAPSADNSFENFKETCSLIFDGPLADVAEERKVSYLKLWSGEEGRRIIKTWQLTADDSKKVDTYWTKFKDYVKPKSNFRIARYKLRECKQLESEPIDMFVKRLRTILGECDYPALQRDTHLLDAMIFGVRLEKIQSMLLQKDATLTVDDAIATARTQEATRQQMDELRGKVQQIHLLDKPRKSAQPRSQPPRAPQPRSSSKRQPTAPEKKQCWNCGRKLHSKGEVCPAKGSRCSNCQKIGHWSTVCLSTQRSHHSCPPRHDRRQPPPHDRDRQDRDRHPQVDDLQLQDDEEDVYLYAIETDEAPSQALVDVKIQSENCSRDLTCKIDTGAEANVMPISTLETILPDARHQIKPTQVRIVAYGNNTISQLGVTSLRVTSAHAVKDCEFFITETSGPIILGLETCTDLKLVTINNEVKKRPLGDTKLRQKILHEYADVFQGIGCFEQECKIILDPNVPPVVHAPRRVPVALRDALKEELDKLVGQDILSPVTYPTDWVNSCVCVSKSTERFACVSTQKI